ncbi:MAG TPA: preprotein translocase subunit SecY [Candidatus Paceibacterota bacterium]|jgi:preprotein translocase subunit SecY|nr:preprotein translocase subunit SecY [Candidatus Paceibacterota bacterium]
MNFFKKIRTIFRDPTLRNKIIFVVVMFFIFRFLAAIPIPGVDQARLSQALADNQLLGLFSALSGGGISSFSIVMLGVAPYITASIIMQVLSLMSPKLKELMQESGEAGRRTYNQYSRLLTVPIAALQGFAFTRYFETQGLIAHLSTTATITNLIIIVAGSILLLWIGELINEFGIGNGTSMIIMAGIIATIPSKVSQFFFSFTPDQLPSTLLYIAIGLIVIVGVVYIYEAERPISITYARQVRGIRTLGGTESYLPLRLTQAGVMPIIFASSLLLFPRFLSTFFATSTHSVLLAISHAMTTFTQTTWLYSIVDFVLVVFFTYFYTAVTFDPKQIAENLQRNGGFVPGIRPGEATTNHIGTIITRITLVGSIFLGIVAVLPLVVRTTTGITAFAIGGTSILITVSVIIDLIRRVDAQIAMQEF